MFVPDEFIPPENDHISKVLGKLVPEKYKGTDRFLDVVTWNVRYFNNLDEIRVERVTDILEQLNADIIVLQEIAKDSLDIVAEKLRERGAGNYVVDYGTTGGRQRVALLYDLDWVVTKDDVEELFGKRTVLTGEGKDAFPRLPLKGFFSAISESTEPFDFQIVGLHLKSQRGGGVSQRQLAAERLKTWLVREAPTVDSDVILIGDWNEPPDSSTWDIMKELEENHQISFRNINNSSSISYLAYKNKSNLGSRLDISVLSMAAMPEIEKPPQVVRWESLDALLDKSPKAKEIKDYLKVVRKNVSDHMPVVTRFFFEEQNNS